MHNTLGSSYLYIYLRIHLSLTHETTNVHQARFQQWPKHWLSDCLQEMVTADNYLVSRNM